MSIAGRYRNAHKLFDKTTKRHPGSQTLQKSKTQNYSRRKHPYLVDPYEYYIENDIPKAWTSKLTSLVRENRPQEAVGLFKSMLVDGQSPDFLAVLSVIKAVGVMGSEDLRCGVHGYSIKLGFIQAEVSVVTALLGVYCHRDLDSAWKLFDQTPNKDVVLWSAMVSAYMSNGEHLEAFKLVKEMICHGLQPNYVTMASVLPACADLGALKLGREIHGYSIKKTIYDHTAFLNSLVGMYSKCKRLKTAIQVFDDMQVKDLISWRIIILGCVENERPRKALEIFLELLSCGLEKVDEYIILDVIRAYSQFNKNYTGQGFHAMLLKMGFVLFPSVATELIQLFVKFGSIDLARNLFSQLRNKDLIAWSAMIAAYAQSKQPHNAFDIFREMQVAGQKPNEFTFVSLLLACTSVSALELGESVHTQIVKGGFPRNAFLTSALIDMYCKFGRTGQGKAIFDDYPIKDIVCWSSMINGYAINGCGEEVLECFSNMLSCGIEPNGVVFISVLSACSHCGLEYDGWNWFHRMETVYGITPNLAHYACMVDMLSRQGNIEEALEFVNNMPIEPDTRIWGALLAGCRNTNGPTEILEFVAKKLVCLDPENTSYYVVLSNLYADQGRWEEVEKLRNMIDTKSLKKAVGYSTI